MLLLEITDSVRQSTKLVHFEYPKDNMDLHFKLPKKITWIVVFRQQSVFLVLRMHRPLFGEKRSLDGLLVKVKMKTLAPSPSQSIGDTQPVSQTACSIEVLGSVATTYCFDGMADYQYIQAPDDTPWNNTEELLHSESMSSASVSGLYLSSVPRRPNRKFYCGCIFHQ